MLRLEESTCVVVGGGEVATRKVERLLDTGTRIAVIAPRCTERLERLSAQGQIHLKRRQYQCGDLSGAALAFAATSSRGVNAAVAAEARSSGIPVNVADDQARCTFQVPALVEQDGVRLAISTGGRSPAFARRLREEIEQLLSPERIALFELYAELRMLLAESGQPLSGEAWSAADQQALSLLRDGRPADARRVLLEQITAAAAVPGE
jgi:precorrin-2 dehydrogenase/sirohydrochlorin ferrochelatase